MKKNQFSIMAIVAEINGKFTADALTAARSINNCARMYVECGAEQNAGILRAWFGDKTIKDIISELKAQIYKNAQTAKDSALMIDGNLVPVIFADDDRAKILRERGGVGDMVSNDVEGASRQRVVTEARYRDGIEKCPRTDKDGKTLRDKKGRVIYKDVPVRIRYDVKVTKLERAYIRKTYTLNDAARAFNDLCADTSAQILRDAIAARTATDAATIATAAQARNGKKHSHKSDK